MHRTYLSQDFMHVTPAFKHPAVATCDGRTFAARGKVCQSPVRLIPDRQSWEQRNSSPSADIPETGAVVTTSPTPTP